MNYLMIYSFVFISVHFLFAPANKTLTHTSIKSDKASLKNDTLYLFDGKKMNNFIFVIDMLNPDETNKYEIENGAVHFYGVQKGYFRTKEVFSNYKLHAEWRWPEKNEKGNSGILIHTQMPDTVWPQCIQVQLKEGRAGDLIAMNGAEIKETMGKPKDTAPIISSNENREGEWNSCDVTCKDDSIIIYVNNLLQNKGTRSNFNSGFIAFQLEGKAIEFKNIYLIKILKK